MKNILIMGIGRAGKTTLSNMIKEKYPQYNLIHSDIIKWALIRSEGKEQYYRENVKEQKQFDDIHILMNKRMREHGLIKRYTINDFIMMFGVEKIDKEEFISWCKRIIIEIIALLFVLKLSQLINEVLWNVVSIIVILYVIGRMIHVPYTKKFYEERKKINTYNKMYNEKWGK